MRIAAVVSCVIGERCDRLMMWFALRLDFQVDSLVVKLLPLNHCTILELGQLTNDRKKKKGLFES